jgi:ribonuclease Z
MPRTCPNFRPDYSAFSQRERPMKLILLGTGGYFPTTRRHTACLMLPEIGVVLDAGSGMCGIGKHLQTDRLDIFLSHAHLDHISGLTYLINLVPADVLKRTTVHGDATKLAAVREHLFAEPIFPVSPQFNFAPLTESCALPNSGTLRHFPLVHPGGSHGFRLDWPGHSMAYITDTTADVLADYVEYIRGVDLLVHEAYFAEDVNNLPANTGHSSLIRVAEVAAAANVGRLVIAHIDPLMEDDSAFDLPAARQIFANMEIGTDGMELQF